MKLKLLTFCILFGVLTSCSKPTGSLSGNLYWNYNDYVGNKPDAGAKIKIYSLENNTSDSLYSIITDINGNYKIENIAEGKYILIANSKNTFSSPRTLLENLQLHSKELEKIQIRLDIENQIEPLKNLKLLTDLTSDKPSEFQKNNRELNDRMSTIIQNFTPKEKQKLGLDMSFDNSIYIKEFKVEAKKNITENIDFGYKNN